MTIQDTRIQKQLEFMNNNPECVLCGTQIKMFKYVDNKFVDCGQTNHPDLDLETFKEMIEVKTGSYFTTGTAGEKVPGVPWKYSEVPDLYGKPLLIILIGGDKKESDLVCKSTLKKEKLTTRDSRAVERKKYGHRKARRSFQFSKR